MFSAALRLTRSLPLSSPCGLPSAVYLDLSQRSRLSKNSVCWHLLFPVNPKNPANPVKKENKSGLPPPAHVIASRLRHLHYLRQGGSGQRLHLKLNAYKLKTPLLPLPPLWLYPKKVPPQPPIPPRIKLRRIFYSPAPAGESWKIELRRRSDLPAAVGVDS